MDIPCNEKKTSDDSSKAISREEEKEEKERKEGKEKEGKEKKAEESDLAIWFLKSIHRCLIYLGDLARLLPFRDYLGRWYMKPVIRI